MTELESSSIKYILIIFFLISLFTLSTPSRVQTLDNKNPEQEGKNSSVSRHWLDIGFEHRSRYENLSNLFRAGQAGGDQLLAQRTRLRLDILDAVSPFGFVIEFQDSRLFPDEKDLPALSTHVNENDLLQIYLQCDLDEVFAKSLDTRLKLGRFTIDLGKRRFFARNSMRNTTNTFEGLLIAFNRMNWELSTFLIQPVLIESERPDSRESHRNIWGVFIHNNQIPGLYTELYYFALNEDSHTRTQRNFTTIGGRLYKYPVQNEIDYEMELAGQFGENLERDHLAYFLHGELGYLFKNSWNTRLLVQFDYASGDQFPDDDKSSQFNTLFGARRFDFNPTGIYGPCYRSNLYSPGVRITLDPDDRVSIMASNRFFWLARSRDAWVGSGLQDTSGESGNYLGHQIESQLIWRFRKYMTFDCGYAHLFKGSYMEHVPKSPRTGDSNYFYLSLDIRSHLISL